MMATSAPPVHTACVERNWRALAQLAPHAAEKVLNSAVSTDGWCPLHYAAAAGNLPALNALLKAGASPAVRAAHGSTPLHLAAWEGHLDIVRALLVANADIGALTNANRTPLHFAARRGHANVLIELIDSGSHISAAEHRGRTALHFAAREGHLACAEALVDSGADLDATDIDGITPPQEATRGGHLDIAKLLVDAGAGTCFDEGVAFPDVARIRRESDSAFSEVTAMTFGERALSTLSDMASFVQEKSRIATSFITRSGSKEPVEPTPSGTQLVQTITAMDKSELAGAMSVHVARGQSDETATEYSEMISRGVVNYNLTGELLLAPFPSAETLAREILEAAGAPEERASRGALYHAVVNFITNARNAKNGTLLVSSGPTEGGGIRREVYAVVGVGILFSLLIPIVRSRSTSS